MPTAKTTPKKTPGRKTVRKVAPRPLDAADVQSVPLGLIINDPALQTRVTSDPDQIDNLKTALEAGEPVPPVVLFAEPVGGGVEGVNYYIGDGWHRYFGHLELKRHTIWAEVHEGGRAEALRYALGANAAHGLRRTNADKRKAVTLALKEYPKLSNRAISEICKVTHTYVNNVRSEVETVSTSRTGKDGKQYPTRSGGTPEQTDFFKLLHDEHDAFAKQGKKLMKELSLVITNPDAPREDKLKDARAILKHAERLKTEIKDLVDALEAQEA